MPRRRSPPRLYLDRKRSEWVIRDGSYFGRTGCLEADHQRAEKLLAQYIASKYKPEPSATPLIADILNVYAKEHLPHTRSGRNALYFVNNLARWFGPLSVSDISARACREYSAGRPAAAARRDLETLRAAVGYWHKEYGPLAVVPPIVLPPKSAPRDRWLTRDEARRLRRAAMKWPHLYRFITVGLLTGSRSNAILSLRWDWIDFGSSTMRRRAAGTSEDMRKRTPPLRIGRALGRLLRRWHRMDKELTPYVVHYNGKPVTRIKRTWKQACHIAGLQGVTPHTLRHTRATWMMQEGVPIWEAAGALGMTPEMLTGTYGKHHPDFQKRAAEV